MPPFDNGTPAVCGTFFELYQPICDWWEVYDNTRGKRRLLGVGSQDETMIDDPDAWNRFERSGYDA